MQLGKLLSSLLNNQLPSSPSDESSGRFSDQMKTTDFSGFELCWREGAWIFGRILISVPDSIQNWLSNEWTEKGAIVFSLLLQMSLFISRASIKWFPSLQSYLFLFNVLNTSRPSTSRWLCAISRPGAAPPSLFENILWIVWEKELTTSRLM